VTNTSGDTTAGCVVPHAVDVVVARGTLAVAETARTGALVLRGNGGLSGGGADDVNPLAVLVAEAGSFVAEVLSAHGSALTIP
jgi:hypothetical protein